MSDFETRANNVQTAIDGARYRINEFGYSQDKTDESVSRIIGMFITWLTSVEEARHQDENLNASFRRNVINRLPNIDNPEWKDYLNPKPITTLKQRASGLWGIRVAFTHGDGDIELIKNADNKIFAQQSSEYFESVSIHDNKLILNEGIMHTAIRTIVQIQDVLIIE
jgi:hypothetical protein